MKLTVELVLSWHPCCPPYDEQRLRELLGDGRTPLEICDLKEVPIVDRLWALLREEVFSKKDLQLLACDFAEQILPLFEPERDAATATFASAAAVGARYAAAAAVLAARYAAALQYDASWNFAPEEITRKQLAMVRARLGEKKDE